MLNQEEASRIEVIVQRHLDTVRPAILNDLYALVTQSALNADWERAARRLIEENNGLKEELTAARALITYQETYTDLARRSQEEQALVNAYFDARKYPSALPEHTALTARVGELERERGALSAHLESVANERDGLMRRVREGEREWKRLQSGILDILRYEVKENMQRFSPIADLLRNLAGLPPEEPPPITEAMAALKKAVGGAYDDIDPVAYVRELRGGDSNNTHATGANLHDIGAMLRTLRKDAGLTLKKAAARAALSLSFISDVERGRTGPSLNTIKRLCAVYGYACSVAVERLPASSRHGPYYDTADLRGGDDA
jgi:DNA-binding XRE family transcriptional regulator